MAQGRSSIARIFARHGVDAEISRMGSPDIVLPITVTRHTAKDEPLEHEISQQGTQFVLEWQQLNDGAYPLPVKKGDRIKKDGIYYTIILVRTMEFYKEVTGYVVTCTGG